MSPVSIEHSYPASVALWREHGAGGVAVLHELILRARPDDGRLVVKLGVRAIADDLGFLSKDTVSRRIRDLERAGILRRLPDPGHPFTPPAFEIDLTSTGLRRIDIPVPPSAA